MKIALKAANGRYVCAEEGGGIDSREVDELGQPRKVAVRADRRDIGPWETWDETPHPDGGVALQTENGDYLTAEEGGGGHVSTSRRSPGLWERWTPIGGGYRTVNGHWLCAEIGSVDPVVNATRLVQGPWEAFGRTAIGVQMLPLVRDGAVLRRSDGSMYDWHEVSGFKLLAHSEPEQDEFLGWWSGQGLIEPMVNVFTCCSNLFDLVPEDGLARLPALLEKAAGYGVRIRAVALIDTAIRSFDYAAHLAAVRAVRHPALVVMGANEPLQSFQANVRELCKQPGRQPTLYGAGPADDGNDESNEFATGDVLFVNSDRREGENGWRWVRHTKECWYDRRVQTGLFSINGEPRRDDLAREKHFALGCMSWICQSGGGDCFHYDGGRFAQIADSEEQAALDARKTGWLARPPQFRGAFFNTGWVGSPVRSFTGALRCYSAKHGDEAFVIALDAAAVRIEWGEGFHAVTEQQVDSARLIHAVR